MRSAVAEKIEKYCDRCSLCYAAVWAQCFSVFSTTADPFLIYLDNHIFFVISVSWFWTTIKSLNAHIRWQYSSVQFSPARFESGFALGTLIREYFENQVQLLYENSTFTIQFFPKIRMVCSHGGDKADCAHCTQFTGACALKFAWCANFQHFFCSCAEKTSFRFDPAYPRPNSVPGWGWEMWYTFRLETQNQARTSLILGSFRPNTCAYLDTLHWK